MQARDYVGVSQIPNAVLFISHDGSIVKANAYAERLFGYEPGELIGCSFDTLFPEKHRKRQGQLVDEFFTNPAVRPVSTGLKLHGLASDGRKIPVEIAIGPVGNGTSAIAVIREISAVETTRAEPRENEPRLAEFSDRRGLFDLVLSSMGDCLAVLDSDGRIIAVNDAWVAFARENGQDSNPNLGVGADYLAVYMRAARTDPLAERALAGIRAVLNGTLNNFRLEYPCHSPTEKRWFSMSATAMKNGKGAITLHADVTDLVVARQQAERALAEVSQLKERLQAESEYLRDEIKSCHNFEEIIGNSESLRATLRKVEHVSKTNSTILLLGETGTGKELLARAIHARSERRNRPLIKVDCATLPSGLIESELFGHEKGAFTGAYETRIGRFELAHEGSIFLDEIGELPLDLQSKLLRVLEAGESRRLGSKHEQKVDIRVIAATNRDLQKEIRAGRFRADLYYRLGVFPIEIPPLRERREDIPTLVAFFVTESAAACGRTIRSIAKTSMDMLEAYDWPGNVRELRNVIERSVILCAAETLELAESLGDIDAPNPAPKSLLKQDLESVERSRILRALDESGWRIKGDGNAASRLGLSPSTLRSRMKKLAITRP